VQNDTIADLRILTKGHTQDAVHLYFDVKTIGITLQDRALHAYRLFRSEDIRENVFLSMA